MPRQRKAELADTNIKVRKSSRDRLNALKRRWKRKSQSDTIDKAYDREMGLEQAESN